MTIAEGRGVDGRAEDSIFDSGQTHVTFAFAKGKILSEYPIHLAKEVDQMLELWGNKNFGKMRRICGGAGSGIASPTASPTDGKISF